ncbi:MAG: GntR family transcriptional regulator [Anaerocolumna sp.]|jgi:DNA-binding GntR family transcriptional regulator|nr:GntR family transcriptional regulator [Anaerocolumna sp.]
MVKNEKGDVKETLVETISKNIKGDIVNHILLPGEKIRIKELAERYGTSEMPVKLALNRLISEQVIENFPRQGMIVRQMSVEEASEIFDIRLMMDLYYIKEIIEAVNLNKTLREQLQQNVQEHYELIHKIYDNNNENLNTDSFVGNYDYDYKFHELYLKSSGNKKIIDVYRSVNPFIYCNYIYNRQSKEKSIAGVEEHRQILQAILNQDEAGLRQALITHMENAKNAIGLILKVDNML